MKQIVLCMLLTSGLSAHADSYKSDEEGKAYGQEILIIIESKDFKKFNFSIDKYLDFLKKSNKNPYHLSTVL